MSDIEPCPTCGALPCDQVITPCGVETTPADQPAVDSHAEGERPGEVRPPIPTPPGGDTRLSGEVEERCARLEYWAAAYAKFGATNWNDADAEAAGEMIALLRRLFAEWDVERSALDVIAVNYKRLESDFDDVMGRLQACEAERDRRAERLDEILDRLERQVPITAAYLTDNKINPHFAAVLMSHYLDLAREARQALKDNEQ